MLSSQEIGLSLLSFVMIYEALQPELFGLKFHSLSSKILRILEFYLFILNMSPTHFVYNIRHERPSNCHQSNVTNTLVV